MSAGAVLVAAGLGTRLGAGKPKALVTLGGTPLVTHAARRLLAAGGVSRLVVVVPPTHEEEFRSALAGVGDAAPERSIVLVPGGLERSDSVRAGLAALEGRCDVVLVHDAARALAPVGLIERVIAAVRSGADAVIPAVAVTDTIKVVAASGAEQEHVVDTPDRSTLRAVQTPQGFRREVLGEAHASGLDATDDAALVERLGRDVVVIAGDPLAMKVTTPIDMTVAVHLLADLSEAEPV